ncbi:MAG: AI-2E family transporter [Thermodesulfovibrionales bacterium]
MIVSKFYSVMLLVILTLLGYLSYQIIRPFLVPISWAAVFSIVFYPVYAFLSRHIKVKSIASSITVFLVVVIIIGPIIYVSFVLVAELRKIGEYTHAAEGPDLIRNLFWKIQSSPQYASISSLVGEQNMPTVEQVMANLANLGKSLAERLSVKVTNLLSVGIDFLFMTFTIFFLFRDGPGFLNKVRDYMPFSEEQKSRLTKQVKAMVASTVYGGVTVAIIQGFLGGLAFYVIGFTSPVLWGITMSIVSFIPLLGTLGVWGPAAIYLLIRGEYLTGAGLIFYGTFVIGLVDNFLRPLLIGSRTKMPTIIIFFSVLGGIEAFGIIGLIMGPLIMAVFISVFEIFRHVKDECPSGDEEQSKIVVP